MVSKALAGAVLLGCAFPACVGQLVNSAKCTSTAIATSSGSATDAFVSSAGSAAAKTCGGDATAEVFNEVSAMATALAEATVKVTGKCETNGSATGQAVAYGFAKKTANAYATAAAEAFAEAEACGSCEAAVSAFASACEEVIAVAIAEAEINVKAVSETGGSDEDAREQLVKVVEEKSIEAFAQVYAAAQANYAGEGDCSAEVGIIAQAGDSATYCDALADGDITEISVNASVTAGSEAAAMACGETGDGVVVATAESVATAFARAVAGAVSEANVICFTEGNAGGCADASVAVSAIASSQAEAFASAFAEAESCGCDVSARLDAEAITQIVVEAASDAYVSVCGSGNAITEAEELEEVIVDVTVTAIAQAISVAAAGDFCFAAADVLVQTLVCDECVKRSRKCAGTGIEGVKPCCNENDHCMKQNDFRSVCRKKTARTPPSFDGTIQLCTPIE